MNVDDLLRQSPFIAILRGVSPGEVLGYAEVIAGAGWRCIEVPLNSPEPLDSIARLAERFKDDLLIGAGTVTRAADVAAVAEAGGRLIVAPNMNEAVIKAALERNMTVMPGFLTPTEAFRAYEAGARHLKLFPADSAGPAYIKAVRSVLPPDAKIVAVGGVSPGNIGAFKNAGACAFGIGSQLYKPGMTVAETAKQAKAFMDAAQESSKASA
jgi:2-dehydro-3-deoxyphosphogalactonate aldolase